MPGLAGLLPWVRIRYHSRVLYLCSEPHLIATLISATIARLCAMRIVLFTWQNVRPDVRMRGCKLWLSNMLVRCNLGLAHGIICGNRKAEAIVHDFVPHMPTVVCPLAGVDTKRFMPDGPNQRELLVSAAGTKLILFAGALDERKGLDTLIRAIARLEQRDAKLVIVGTGPFRANLEKLAYELGITDRVIFRDWVRNEDLPQIMHSANVFAYPSVPRGGWEEQFGYAMAEASACGVPVVATRTGSIDEVVIHERTGLLVEPNNSEALARALDSILQDTEYAHQLGNAGRAYVAEHFSHQAIAHRIERFLASFQ